MIIYSVNKLCFLFLFLFLIHHQIFAVEGFHNQLCSNKCTFIETSGRRNTCSVSFYTSRDQPIHHIKIKEKKETINFSRITPTISLLICITTIFHPNQGAGATSFDEYFSSSKYQDPLKVKARKELNKLKELEDSRLDLCADKGKNWEQCFMFGESNTIQSEKKLPVNVQVGPTKAVNDEARGATKNRISNSPPTW